MGPQHPPQHKKREKATYRRFSLSYISISHSCLPACLPACDRATYYRPSVKTHCCSHDVSLTPRSNIFFSPFFSHTGLLSAFIYSILLTSFPVNSFFKKNPQGANLSFPAPAQEDFCTLLAEGCLQSVSVAQSIGETAQ